VVAHGDRCPQCCLFFVSVAHAAVLENAGTIGLYTKTCFSSRLYSLVLLVRAPESRERGAKKFANHFEDNWCCDTNRGGYNWRNVSVVLPKFGSTTDENPEGTTGWTRFKQDQRRGYRLLATSSCTSGTE
jgi:hypothetical protein